MKKYCVVVFVVVMVNQLSLFGMDKKPQEIFHCLGNLAPELQQIVILHIDNLSYIGQSNKAWFAEVKKQQLDHIVDMHQQQNPRLARPNIPPLVFFGVPFHNGDRRDGKRAIDPNSRIFYKESTKNKYPLGCGAYHDRFHIDFSGDDKYQRVGPTNLLIACLTQNECEVKRLLRFYPLVKQHIIAGDCQSEKLYKDGDTKRLFLEALCASRVIANNKATCILLEYLEKANLSEDSLIQNMPIKKEKRVKQVADQRRYEGFVLHMMPGFMRQQYQPTDEEMRARKEFEDMILSFSSLPKK